MTGRRLLLLAVQIGGTALIILALWRYTQTSDSFVVAHFSDIWSEFKLAFLFDRVETDVWPTIRRMGLSYLLAVSIGLGVGLAIGLVPTLRMMTAPAIAFIRAVSPVALIPPAIILFGLGDKMVIILTVFVAMWPVVLNTAAGIPEINQTMRDTAGTFRLTRWQRMRYVIIPSIAPRAFAGMHTALAFVIITVIAVEFIAGSEGIGYIAQEAQNTFLMSQMWAAIVLLGILGNLVNLAFLAVQRRALFWLPKKADLTDIGL